MLTNNQIIEDVRGYIIDRLDDLKGYKHCLYDLGYDVTQCDNVSGSVFYNTYSTITYLAENYFDVQEVIDEIGDELIDTGLFFKSPESFHVQLLVVTAEYICSCIDLSDRIDELNSSDDDEDHELADTLQSLADGDLVEFTSEIIDELKNAIENL